VPERPVVGVGGSAAPWLTVVNPDVFMTFCGECGEHFRKGGKVQRIEGGYGYRCERCGSETAATG
jgi:predicted SprT family Zn-dependent metalloprotease